MTEKLVDLHIRKISEQVRKGIKATAWLRGVSMNTLMIEILTKFVRENTEHDNKVGK